MAATRGSKLQRGRAGRGNRTPVPLRVVEGTEHKGPKGAPPVAGGPLGRAPPGTSVEVRRWWNRVAREVGWLSQSSDRIALLDLCRVLAEVEYAYGRMVAESRFGEDLRDSPWARRWERMSDMALRRLRLFGMTPTDAVRLMTGERPGGAPAPDGAGAFIR